MNGVTAFPLHWPPHRKRLAAWRRTRAAFHRQSDAGKQFLTIADSRNRLYRELGLLGASGVIISANLELKLDGTPRSNQRDPEDPGIAVYFQLQKLPHCLSCDSWDRCADNLAAIAKHVESMRGQLRWGVADVATMFSGFKALPGAIITPQAMTPEEAADYLAAHSGVPASLILSDAGTWSEVYRGAAKRLHPDRNNGVELPEWHRLQSAADALRQHHLERGQS